MLRHHINTTLWFLTPRLTATADKLTNIIIVSQLTFLDTTCHLTSHISKKLVKVKWFNWKQENYRKMKLTMQRLDTIQEQRFVWVSYKYLALVLLSTKQNVAQPNMTVKVLIIILKKNPQRFFSLQTWDLQVQLLVTPN